MSTTETLLCILAASGDPLLSRLGPIIGPIIGTAVAAALYQAFPNSRKRLAVILFVIGWICLTPILLVAWGVLPSGPGSGPTAPALEFFFMTVFFVGLTCLMVGGGLLLYIAKKEREERGE